MSESEKTINIRLVGVGGQGILLAGEVLCEALLALGHDVKKSEVHGMSQRGGSVNSDIRFGAKVYSPTIPEGAVDFLVSFERMEALRYAASLAPKARVIVNAQRITPMTVSTGAGEYPGEIEEKLRARGVEVVTLNGEALARRAGSVRSVNIALLGALARWLDVDPATWDRVLRERLAGKAVDVNLKAFALGREA